MYQSRGQFRPMHDPYFAGLHLHFKVRFSGKNRDQIFNKFSGPLHIRSLIIRQVFSWCDHSTAKVLPKLCKPNDNSKYFQPRIQEETKNNKRNRKNANFSSNIHCRFSLPLKLPRQERPFLYYQHVMVSPSFKHFPEISYKKQVFGSKLFFLSFFLTFFNFKKYLLIVGKISFSNMNHTYRAACKMW